jgi:hypothetical protein
MNSLFKVSECISHYLKHAVELFKLLNKHSCQRSVKSIRDLKLLFLTSFKLKFFW